PVRSHNRPRRPWNDGSARVARVESVESGDSGPKHIDRRERMPAASHTGQEERGGRAMTTEIPVRSLHQVERGIEEALRDFAGGVNGSELPEITAAERIDKIGNMSALAIAQASELTAK